MSIGKILEFFQMRNIDQSSINSRSTLHWKNRTLENFMLSEQQLIEKWRKLSILQQKQVVEFIELLESQKTENGSAIPAIEIWSPYDSTAAAQVLLKLLENDPGEELA